MSGRPNNAKTLQRRHFLAGAAGTLLTPLAVAQSSSPAVIDAVAALLAGQGIARR